MSGTEIIARWRDRETGIEHALFVDMFSIIMALIVGIFSRWPREFLFVGAIAYLASGPLMRLWSVAFPSRNVPEETLEPVEAP